MSKEGWFVPSYGVPAHVKDQIHQWVQAQQWPDGTKLKHPDKYHITSFYSPEGYLEPSHHEWLKQDGGQSFPATTHSLDSFDSPNPNSGLKPVVMRFYAPELSAHAEGLMSAAEARGLQPTRFPGGHKPHITVAEASELPNATPPQIHFQTEPLHELHSYYDSLKRQANILDSIRPELSPLVFDNPAEDRPILKPQHRRWLMKSITKVLREGGYDGMEKWLSLVFTGSLTTYQYSDDSDVDISLFVDTKNFPDWSRAEMIGLMVDKMDGTILPGTPHPLQCFVVASGITKDDLYKPGVRSGYDLQTNEWIVPPERGRVHDVQAEMSAQYIHALQQADKMEKLLKYEPDKAVMFWHQIHRRRRRDMMKGRGDYADSNITYKMLANRKLFPAISEVSGEYIAKTAVGVEPLPEFDIAATAYQATVNNGGITIRIDGVIPTMGYAFSPFKGQEKIIPVAALTEEDLAQYVDEHKQQLTDLVNHLGTWVDGLNAYVDVSQVQVDYDTAYKLAWDAEQEAMWDIAQQKEIPVRKGGSSPLEIADNFLQVASRLAVNLDQPQVAKFVYNVPTNHLVIGSMAREEGEVESHFDLMRKAGLEQKNNVYGQFGPDGRVETFGRPKIEGFGKPAMNPKEADYRAKQALEATVPGTHFDTFTPGHDKWTLTDPPKVTYMREPPIIGQGTVAPSDSWAFAKTATFSKVAAPWNRKPKVAPEYPPYAYLKMRRDKHPDAAAAYIQHVEQRRRENFDRGYQLGVSPYKHDSEKRMRTDHEFVNSLNRELPIYHEKQHPQGYTSEMDNDWHRRFREDKKQRYLNDPNVMADDYQQWLDWYAQHAPEHFDPEGVAANAEDWHETPAPNPKAWISKTAGSWSVDPRAIDKAATHLGLKHPVEVRVEGGTYGQYQGLQNGTHIIKAVSWLKPASANEQIWHELVHAKQAEGGMEFPERPEAYDDYRAQPHEQEAHDFAAPFPVVLPMGENDGSDNRMAVS